MITEQVTQLKDRIANLERLRQQAQYTKAFQTRADLLGPSAQRLSGLVKTLAEFRERQIPVQIPVDKVRALQTHLVQLTEAYQANPDSIREADEDRNFRFWQRVKELPEEIERALKQAWQGHVLATIRPGQTELLLVLEQLPGFKEPGREIRDGLRQAVALQQLLPTASDFSTLTALAQQVNDAWEDLPADEISPEILSFLQAASKKTATLQLVTPSVREWLEKHSLLQAFKVTL